MEYHQTVLQNLIYLDKWNLKKSLEIPYKIAKLVTERNQKMLIDF